jgi:hypothetical protein
VSAEDSVPAEAWRTDEDLASARQRFAAGIAGYLPPAAYGVARLDAERLVWGAVNGAGHIHRLPAAVLASVCGYTSQTATFRLTAADLGDAVYRLTPAEAALHWEHPNLWSWRDLLAGAAPTSEFLAFFVADDADAPVDDHDAAFRQQVAG